MSNISRLSAIHELNKKHLEEMDFRDMKPRSVFNNFNSTYRVSIVDRYDDLLLIDYFVNRTTYKYLRVKDSSTRKHHFLSVPNNIRECRKALAWTFGLKPSDYKLKFET